MEVDKNFNSELFNAFSNKLAWYTSTQIPLLQSNYVNMHSLVENILKTLINKGALAADPYKNDKKISKVTPIDCGSYIESDRAQIIGARLSDYEMMLDFICNYFNFSITTLSTDQIKALLQFNEGFTWSSIATTSKSQNTRGLAEALNTIRRGSDSFATDLANNSLHTADKTMSQINAILNDLASFQREVYKMNIRKDVLEHPTFEESDYESKEKMEAKIRQVYKQTGNKAPYDIELVKEVIEETIGENKEEYRKKLFEKFEVQTKEKKAKKENKVNPHDILMETLLILSTVSGQALVAEEKLQSNSINFEMSKLSKFQKFLLEIRRALGLKDKPCSYKISITDQNTQIKRSEIINFQEFIMNLDRKAKACAALGKQETTLYKKIISKSDEEILDFIMKQINEFSKILQIISGLDDFFKTQTPRTERAKIQGISMEITAIKNSLYKTNQKKSDYISIVEEERQMARLGISDDDVF
ncbi:MAG: hypothetical protein SPI86_01785 [Treponemataceae bacterium]|nr:hypothetical protein [Spirochaetales bacterium]MDY6030470.1 hypothetical protein [Treponemataceae bacterium]